MKNNNEMSGPKNCAQIPESNSEYFPAKSKLSKENFIGVKQRGAPMSHTSTSESSALSSCG